jgi:hypothetical protein
LLPYLWRPAKVVVFLSPGFPLRES